MKLNVLLAVTDQLRVKYKNMIANYAKFFAKSQGSFQGRKATYVPKADMVDEPTKRSYVHVITTVDEKFKYFIAEAGEFVNALFSQEKTNSSGAMATLMVNDKDWGTYSSLELLRLKSLLESSDLGSLEQMLASIPVRSDAQIWGKSTSEEYTDRSIYESSLQEGVAKTTVKEDYILEDPNVKAGKIENYTPKVSNRSAVIEVGDYTNQTFTGEWSQREKAGTLKRRNDLLVAVVKALKECNEIEVIQSSLTAEKIFGFILYNK